MIPIDPADHLATLPEHVQASEFVRCGWRPNAAAVIRRPADGLVLWAERSDVPGSWQFPQGGVDAGESPEQAVWRELTEELGVRRPRDVLHLVRGIEAPVCYAYPVELLERWIEGRRRTWLGQAQHWFLFDFVGDDDAIFTLEPPPGIGREFSRVDWGAPDARIDQVIDFKRGAVARGLRALGLTD